MNQLVILDVLALRGALAVTVNEKEGYFIPRQENAVNEYKAKDGSLHASLALTAREYGEAYRSKCEGNAPTHSLEIKEDKAKEMELFAEYQRQIEKEHPEFRGIKPSECEDLRKAIFKRMREARTTVGKVYGG